MDRRNFMQISGCAWAGAMLLGKPLVEFGRYEPIFGQNEKRYTLDQNWVKSRPEELPVNDCHEMFQDSKGRIVLLTNETKNNIIHFDKKGRVLQTWGHDFPGGHGLSSGGEKSDEVYLITDTEKHQFYMTTPEGKLIRTWDFPVETGKYAKAEEFTPTETVMTRSGEIYVADGYGAQYVIHYDSSGKVKNVFGGRGEGDEHLDNAHGITIDYRTTTPTLLVTDRTRCCFKRFSMEGRFLEKIELPGACVCRPVIKGDYLYAAVLRSPDLGTADSGFVIILNKENKPVSVIGGAEPAYAAEGKLKPFYQTLQLFKHPHDVMIDDDDNLYVCQWSSGNVYPYRFVPIR